MNKRKNLKVFRAKQDLTQAEMSGKLNYSRSQYALIERGDRDGTQAFWNNLQTVFSVSDEEMWKLMKKG